MLLTSDTSCVSGAEEEAVLVVVALGLDCFFCKYEVKSGGR